MCRKQWKKLLASVLTVGVLLGQMQTVAYAETEDKTEVFQQEIQERDVSGDEVIEEKLENTADIQNATYDEMKATIEMQSVSRDVTKYYWPVDLSVDGKFDGYKGIDFACAKGSPVYAAEAGTVRIVDYGCTGSHYITDSRYKCSKGTSCAAYKKYPDNYGGWGNYVEIVHTNGQLTRYNHMITGSWAVSNGQYVSAGTYLGQVGNAGNTRGGTGYHLCFEIQTNANDTHSRVEDALTKGWLIREKPGQDSQTIDSRYPTPFRAYTILEENRPLYKYVNGERGGSVYPTDECIIEEVYTNGWVKLSCPWSDGSYQTRYCPLNEFIAADGYAPFIKKQGRDENTYSRNNMANQIGHVNAGQQIVGVQGDGVNLQLIYWDAEKNSNVCAWVKDSFPDETAPKITNVRISDVTAEGYTVQCTVEDNSKMDKVVFVTWTPDINGEDDRKEDVVTSGLSASGTNLSYRVNISDHYSRTGRYATQIYAYDASGNEAHVLTNAVIGTNVLKPMATIVANGHQYELYDDHFQYWTAAKTYCDSIGGHLVTITSKEEQEMVNTLLQKGGCSAYWSGKTDESSEGSWSWVTGEQMNYTNWASGQPDNYNGIESYGQVYKNGTWNDAPNDVRVINESGDFGFICEYEQPVVTATATYNGHTYELYDIAYIDWQDAVNHCNSIGGYLVSITSAEEQKVVENLIQQGSCESYWIGATDEAEEGKWKWASGETVNYTNWASGQPDNDNGVEDYGSIWKNGLWNDAPRQVQRENGKGIYGFICEYGTLTLPPKQSVLTVTAGTSLAETTFSWTKVEGAASYHCLIYKDKFGQGIDKLSAKNLKNNSYKVILEAGHYEARIDTENEYGCTEGAIISFDVKEQNKLEITREPSDVTASVNDKVSFSVLAKGDGLTYEWQYADKGSDTWGKCYLSGYNTNTLTVTATAYRMGMKFRCVVSDKYGATCTSKEATIKKNQLALKITKDPEDQKVNENTNAVFRVSATEGDVKYQWQYANAGSTEWVNCYLSGYNTSALSVKATAYRNGMQFRCIVSDSDNAQQVISKSAKLIVQRTQNISITGQPVSQSVKLDEYATFTVKATGDDLEYQWEYADPGSTVWQECRLSGYNTNTLKVKATVYRNGMQFRCIVKYGQSSVTSNAVKLTLAASEELAITKQPTSVTAKVGDSIAFRVTAKGSGLKYQWQYTEPGIPDEWKQCFLSGYNTDTLKVNVTAYRIGMQFRCLVTDSAGKTVTSSSASIQKESGEAGIEITQQPTAQQVEINANAVFYIKAEGSNLKYQWEYANAGTQDWESCYLSGYNTSTLTVKGVVYRDGMQFRCVVSDSNGNQVISNGVKLSVGSKAEINITAQPKDQSVGQDQTVSFMVVTEGNGLKYQWQYADAGSSNWKNCYLGGYATQTLTVKATNYRNGMQFRCVITDAQGNTKTSDKAVLYVNALQQAQNDSTYTESVSGNDAAE